jgi:hypothetical protein
MARLPRVTFAARLEGAAGPAVFQRRLARELERRGIPVGFDPADRQAGCILVLGARRLGSWPGTPPASRWCSASTAELDPSPPAHRLAALPAPNQQPAPALPATAWQPPSSTRAIRARVVTQRWQTASRRRSHNGVLLTSFPGAPSHRRRTGCGSWWSSQFGWRLRSRPGVAPARPSAGNRPRGRPGSPNPGRVVVAGGSPSVRRRPGLHPIRALPLVGPGIHEQIIAWDRSSHLLSHPTCTRRARTPHRSAGLRPAGDVLRHRSTGRAGDRRRGAWRSRGARTSIRRPGRIGRRRQVSPTSLASAGARARAWTAWGRARG